MDDVPPPFEEAEPEAIDIDTLPVSERIRNLIKGTDDPDHPYENDARRVFAVLVAMAGAGCADDEMRAVMNGTIGAHIRAQRNPEYYLTKQIENARIKVIDPRVVKLNKTYAVILVGGKAVILKTPEGEKGFELLAVSAFREWLGNQFVQHGKKPVTLATHWLKSPQRRQYAGIIFAPNQDTPNHYNVWKGFAVTPREGDCSKFLTHLHKNVCNGDTALTRWVTGWLADLVQHPDTKPGTALVLRGEMGVGKSKVGEVIGSLLGDHYAPVSDPRYITGRFNSHMVMCLLLQAEEAFWAGDHVAEGKLRDLVTGQYHYIEFKGKDSIRVRNYIRLLVTGNQNWVVPAGYDERRFATLDVAPHQKQNHAYFAAIDEEMDNDGREALLYYLLNFDLSGINLRTIPKTAALQDQVIASLNAEAGWLLDLLSRGELPWGCDEVRRCPTAKLFDSYINHARKRGVNRRAIEVSVGMFLTKHVPKLANKEGTYRIWNGTILKTVVDGRVYEFPPLADCRKAFARIVGQTIPWDDRQEWTKAPQPGFEVDEEAPF